MRHDHLYLILDLYSRKIVGFEVHETDDSEHAVNLLRRTAKYRPQFPVKGFADLEQAREWASSFVRWYNHDHRHSAIRYVSPAQRHAGEDRAVLHARHTLYQRARARAPRRWARHTRNWNPITVVTLNPERDAVVRTATESLHKPRSAA